MRIINSAELTYALTCGNGFYAPNLTSADLGSDGTPASALFVVDENTPHALMIVPVPTGGGMTHNHGK